MYDSDDLNIIENFKNETIKKQLEQEEYNKYNYILYKCFVFTLIMYLLINLIQMLFEVSFGNIIMNVIIFLQFIITVFIFLLSFN